MSVQQICCNDCSVVFVLSSVRDLYASVISCPCPNCYFKILIPSLYFSASNNTGAQPPLPPPAPQYRPPVPANQAPATSPMPDPNWVQASIGSHKDLPSHFHTAGIYKATLWYSRPKQDFCSRASVTILWYWAGMVCDPGLRSGFVFSSKWLV